MAENRDSGNAFQDYAPRLKKPSISPARSGVAYQKGQLYGKHRGSSTAVRSSEEPLLLWNDAFSAFSKPVSITAKQTLPLDESGKASAPSETDNVPSIPPVPEGVERSPSNQQLSLFDFQPKQEELPEVPVMERPVDEIQAFFNARVVAEIPPNAFGTEPVLPENTENESTPIIPEPLFSESVMPSVPFYPITQEQGGSTPQPFPFSAEQALTEPDCLVTQPFSSASASEQCATPDGMPTSTRRRRRPFGSPSMESESPEVPEEASCRQSLPAESPPGPVENLPRASSATHINWVRVFLLVLISGMIIAFLSVAISTLIELNDNQLRDFTVSGGNVVPLLPGGNTYPPTNSPAAPSVTPSPTPVIAVYDPIRDSQAQKTRSSVAAYRDNPLRNTLPEIQQWQELNSDIVGRIIVPGVLEELVVRGGSYYLSHDVYGNDSDKGAAYVGANIGFKDPPENLIICGQGNENASVFFPLTHFVSGGWGFASAAVTMNLMTPYDDETYYLFAVIDASNNVESQSYFNYSDYSSFRDDDEMTAFVEKAQSRSLYRFNVDVQPTDRLVTIVVNKADRGCILLMYRMKRISE